MILKYEYDMTAIMGIEFIPENDVDRRVSKLLEKQKPSKIHWSRDNNISMSFGQTTDRRNALVRDPPQATLEELLSRVIAIEDILAQRPNAASWHS